MISAERLVYRHGAFARQLAERMSQQPKLKEIVCACEPVRRVEIHHAVEQEWAFDVDSVSRRTRLGLGTCSGMGCAARCGAIVAELREEAPAVGQRMAYDFLCRSAKHRASIVAGPQLKQEAVLRQYTQSLRPRGGAR
jgi:glycerol-3-phosphate dehydrogenase